MPFFRSKSQSGSAQIAIGWRLFQLLLLCAVADGIYLAFIWPDWQALSRGGVPKSAFIKQYEAVRVKARNLPRLRWHPVPLGAISDPMRRAVILSEDMRFYSHHGIDPVAIREALGYNWERGRIAFGASTISQQTVKNLFLSASRDPLRKWHEVVLTLAMERNLRKRRILEIYLNIAEFGKGIYGVDAAARYYWGISASELTMDEAMSLAASLPSPRQHNPYTQTRAFQRRLSRIERQMHELELLEQKKMPVPASQPQSQPMPAPALITQSQNPVDAVPLLPDAKGSGSAVDGEKLNAEE